MLLKSSQASMRSFHIISVGKSKEQAILFVIHKKASLFTLHYSNMVLELLEGETAVMTHDDSETYAVNTQVIIDAPAAKVWAVLTDFDKLAEWSPGMVKFEGEWSRQSYLFDRYRHAHPSL